MKPKAAEQEGQGATIQTLLDLLAAHGGTIVSTASMQPEWIAQARASGRLYVDENSLGFVWEPDIKRIPETVEEVEWFEKWYPNEMPLPEHLKNPDFLFKNNPPTPSQPSGTGETPLDNILNALKKGMSEKELKELDRYDTIPFVNANPNSSGEEGEKEVKNKNHE